MIVKGKPPMSYEAWSKKYGVSMDIIERYNEARARISSNARAFAKRYGVKKSQEIPRDIRQYTPYGSDFVDFLEARTRTLEDRASHTAQYLTKRADTFLSNVLTVLQESASTFDASETEWLEGNLTRMTTRQKTALINAMGNSGPKMLIHSNDAGEVEIEYDVANVLEAIGGMME